MATRAQEAAEAYRRGLMGPNSRAEYEEAVRRGIVKDAYAKGRTEARGGRLPVVGSVLTASENMGLPVDEVQAGLAAGITTLTGGGRKGRNPFERLGDNYTLARNYQAGVLKGFEENNPNAANLNKGGGFALQAFPMAATGGASAAPAAASRATNLFQKGAAALQTGGRNAAVGGAYASGNAVFSRGTGAERLKAANDAVLPGAAAGVVAPILIGAPGAVARGPVGRSVTRATNRVAEKFGVGFLNPETEALKRVGEALRADKFTTEEIQGALQEWNRVGGPSPAFMDLISRGGRGQQTMALFRGSAMSGAGRTEAATYGKQVATDLTGNAQNRTSQLIPDQRTVPTMEANIQRRIDTNSQAPQVQPGSGGAAVSGRLNAGYDKARQTTNTAYDAVRASNPEQAMLERAYVPKLAANIRESVRDYDPMNIPRVTRELASLDNLSTANARDLFDLRSRLTALRASADPVEASAAKRAVTMIDQELDNAVSGSKFTGDASVVGLAKDAVNARRVQGQQFESDDMLAGLVAREPRGGGMANTVAPEDASGFMLGRTGVGQRPNTIRDWTRIRDTLGADSSEWNAFRQEARARLLGQDAGTERFGQAYARFEQNNPELARLLTTPQERAALARSRANITSAVGSRQSLTTGQAVTTRTPDAYQASMGRDRGALRVGATRSLEDQIGRAKEGGVGVLNTISGQSNTGRNLANTFGDDAAADYRQSIGQMVDQTNNARFINPNTNSQSAGRLFDSALVDLPEMPKSMLGVLNAVWRAVQRGSTLTGAEREALVKIATSKIQGPEAVAARKALAALPEPMPGPKVGNLFAVRQGDQENRR